MKLSVRLPLAFGILTALPLATLGWFAFDQGRASLEEHARHTLENTSAGKQMLTERWLEDAIHDVRIVSAAPGFVDDAQAALAGDPRATNDMRARLSTLVLVGGSHATAAALVRPGDGSVVVSVSSAAHPNALISPPPIEGDFVEPQVQGVTYDAEAGHWVLELVAPVLDPGGMTVAAVVTHLDFAQLSLILTTSSEGSETEETYLVDSEGRVATSRKFAPPYPLSTPAKTAAVSACPVGGRPFTATYTDYRGVSVVGHAMWLPLLHICMISKMDASEALSDVNRLETAVIIGWAGATTVATLLGLGLALSLSRSLARLRRGAAELSAGATDVRLPTSSDEIGQLAREFNAMADAIVTREQALASANRELQAAREAAEEANRAKSDFISRMSHELRTPLNVILGFGQILQLDTVSPEQAAAINQILRAGHHLLGLIDDLLDVSRIEAGRLRLSVEPVHLQSIIRESMDLLAPLATARSISLKLEDDLDPNLHVRADRQRLRQVLLNLISNAIKYNRPNGSVTLSCQQPRSQTVRISVSDTGPGIPEDKRDRLFQPFDRLGAEANPATDGTGLGLYLARSLVHAMGGRLDVTSRPGEGSTFWFELPLETAPQPTPADVSGGGAQAPATPSAPERPAQVLYIEDNLANVDLLEAVLRRRPATQLISAMQGSIGLQMARDHVPDLIILDLRLPDMPGERVLASLKSDPTTASVPVIVASADASESTRQRILASGAAGYITKPFNIRDLLAAIDSFLQPAMEGSPEQS